VGVLLAGGLDVYVHYLSDRVRVAGVNTAGSTRCLSMSVRTTFARHCNAERSRTVQSFTM